MGGGVSKGAIVKPTLVAKPFTHAIGESSARTLTRQEHQVLSRWEAIVADQDEVRMASLTWGSAFCRLPPTKAEEQERVGKLFALRPPSA